VLGQFTTFDEKKRKFRCFWSACFLVQHDSNSMRTGSRNRRRNSGRVSQISCTPLRAALPQIRSSKNDPPHVPDVTFRRFCGTQLWQASRNTVFGISDDCHEPVRVTHAAGGVAKGHESHSGSSSTYLKWSTAAGTIVAKSQSATHQ
jgi:hypothetical protein